MEKLQSTIEKLKKLRQNNYQLTRGLLVEGFEEKDIQTAFDNKWMFKQFKGNKIGIAYIAVAVITLFFIKSTIGSFDYDLKYSGDYYRLNEWVLKPFLIVSFLLIGIRLLINKGAFNKIVQYFLINFCVLFFLSGFVGSSESSIVISVVALILLWLTKSYQTNPKSDVQLLVEGVQNKTNAESVLNQLGIVEWNGHYFSIILLLCFTLYLNSPIHIAGNSFNNLTTLDTILTSTLKLLWLGSLVTGIFLYNKKNHNVIKGLLLLSVIHIGLCLFHSKFQTSIYPCILILLFGLNALRNKPFTFGYKFFSILIVLGLGISIFRKDLLQTQIMNNKRQKIDNKRQTALEEKGTIIQEQLTKLTTDDYLRLTRTNGELNYGTYAKIEQIKGDSLLIAQLRTDLRYKKAETAYLVKEFYIANKDSLKTFWANRKDLNQAVCMEYDSIKAKAYIGFDFLQNGRLYLIDYIDRIDDGPVIKNRETGSLGSSISMNLHNYGTAGNIIKFENLEGDIAWNTTLPYRIERNNTDGTFTIRGDNYEADRKYKFILHVENDDGKRFKHLIEGTNLKMSIKRID